MDKVVNSMNAVGNTGWQVSWFGKRKVIWVDYGPPGDPEPDFWYEMVIKEVIIQDGMESYHVGFLPIGMLLPMCRTALLNIN
jgi:hypothetical protein